MKRELDVVERVIAELVLWKEAQGRFMVCGHGSRDYLLCEEMLAGTLSTFPN